MDERPACYKDVREGPEHLTFSEKKKHHAGSRV